MARKRTKIGVGPDVLADLKHRFRAATDLRDKERLQVALWATGGRAYPWQNWLSWLDDALVHHPNLAGLFRS